MLYAYIFNTTRESKALLPPRRSGLTTVGNIGAITGEQIQRMDINCGPVL